MFARFSAPLRSRAGVIGINLGLRGLGLVRDLVAAFLIPTTEALVSYVASMRFIYAIWTLIVDQAATNTAFSFNHDRIPWLNVAGCTLLAGIAGLLLTPVLAQYFFDIPQPAILLVTIPIAVMTVTATGFAIAYRAKTNNLTNVGFTGLLTVSVIFVIAWVAFTRIESAIAILVLMTLLPCTVVLAVAIWAAQRAPHGFTGGFTFGYLWRFSIFLFGGFAAQVPIILAHSYSLNSAPIVPLFYYVERVVIIVPLTLFSVAISHFMREFSAIRNSSSPNQALRLFTRSVAWNVLVGGSMLAAIAAISILTVPIWKNELWRLSFTERDFAILMIGLCVGASFWLVEMIALRALAVMGHEGTNLRLTIVAVVTSVGAFLLVQISPVSTSLGIVLIWSSPLVVRGAFSFIVVHGLLRLESRANQASSAA